MKPTPHIGATTSEQIAKTVLLPGDPLRAKHIADTYLEDCVQFNGIRNMLGYTGKYRGKPVSVMGSGMGMPSIGIYSYELIHFYGVERLIRVGSCGSLQPHVRLRDVVMGMAASTNSGYARQFNLPGTFAPSASWSLLQRAVQCAEGRGIAVKVGNILSSDVFYDDNPDAWKQWAKMGVLAVEMEAAALYMNAARAGVEALCILTVSDSLVTHESTSAADRQTSFNQMVEVALDIG